MRSSVGRAALAGGSGGFRLPAAEVVVGCDMLPSGPHKGAVLRYMLHSMALPTRRAPLALRLSSHQLGFEGQCFPQVCGLLR